MVVLRNRRPRRMHRPPWLHGPSLKSGKAGESSEGGVMHEAPNTTRAALGSPPIVKKKSSTRNFKFQVMETYLPNLRTFLAPNSSA
jgi:hypothetical protein